MLSLTRLLREEKVYTVVRLTETTACVIGTINALFILVCYLTQLTWALVGVARASVFELLPELLRVVAERAIGASVGWLSTVLLTLLHQLGIRRAVVGIGLRLLSGRIVATGCQN